MASRGAGVAGVPERDAADEPVSLGLAAMATLVMEGVTATTSG